MFLLPQEDRKGETLMENRDKEKTTKCQTNPNITIITLNVIIAYGSNLAPSPFLYGPGVKMF